MQLQWQSIRVKEERHFLSGIIVGSDRLALDAHLRQRFYLGLDVFHVEGKVAKAAGLRAAGTLGWIFLCENFQLGVLVHPQVQLPVPPCRAIIFPDDLKAQLLNIKALGGLIVGHDNGDMVDGR